MNLLIKWKQHFVWNLWNVSKAAEGKFIALNIYIRKEKQSRVNDLSSRVKELVKEEQIKRNPSREIILTVIIENKTD